MINNSVLLFGLIFFFASCSGKSEKNSESSIEHELTPALSYELQVVNTLITDSAEHFRGLDLHNGIAYIAGSKGSILAYDLTDQTISEIYFAEGRHLRDIDILENGNIIALAITEPAEILLKEASSDAFRVVYSGTDPLTFLDGIDFLNNQEGIAFGDPINQLPTILRTQDGGETWKAFTDSSLLISKSGTYAGFAASGTSIKYLNQNTVLIGLGNETGKVLRSDDSLNSWKLIDLPYHYQPEGSGVYAMAFADNKNGVAVGGHWQNTSCDSSKIYTHDGGISWNLSTGIQEYRSCVTHFKNQIYIATGTSGTDISYDGGKSWELLDTIGYNAIIFQENGKGIAVGSYGQIDLLDLIEKK